MFYIVGQMPSLTPKILLITEDFPSGLNGTSVKTRNTLIYLLEQNFSVDVCCFHFDHFKIHALKHKNLKIYSVPTTKRNKKSLSYLFYLFSILLSVSPITLKRLFNVSLKEKVQQLKRENNYGVVLYDGYSTLQYLDERDEKAIYIDDEDFTDLFRQRFLLEKNLIKKIYYGSEFLRSRLFESIKFPKVGQIWAISPRTKERLKKISGKKTVLMPTIIPWQKNIYRGQGKNLVFTGTLNWRENVEALEWFLSKHWRGILKKLPDTTLTIIGQGAENNFANYLMKQPNIRYLGYTPDLTKEYERATLAISPVLINAGIKVKTLTYLSYGLPVVSSLVAAWGLKSVRGVVLAEEDDFGEVVAKLLTRPKILQTLSKLAEKNIKQNYSQEKLKVFLSKNWRGI